MLLNKKIESKMKKIFIVITLTFIISMSYGQSNHISNNPYDSLVNIPRFKVTSLYGQSVIVTQSTYLHLKKSDKQTNTPEGIIGKQFLIVSAERDKAKPNHVVWLTLTSELDTVYYRLTNSSMDRPSIITTGHIEKMKIINKGKTFELKCDEVFLDMNSETNTSFPAKSTFKCIDVVVLQKEINEELHDGSFKREIRLTPSFILVDNHERKISIPLDGFGQVLNKNMQLFNKL